MTEFATALESGAELLRSLPRRRSGVSEARRVAGEWAARHPDVRARLVVDQRPGTPVVDYDLVLDHPDGGTVALTAPPEDGVPWLVDHSTHWAAGQLVTVDDVHVSVPQALTMLRSLSRGGATPYQEIVDQCLLASLVDDTVAVSAADLQATADEFRRGRGLRDRAATLAWLASAGMSEERFEAYITGIARRRRFRLDKEGELAAARLDARPGDFARVRAVWVAGGERVPAASPGELFGRLADMSDAVVTVGTCFDGDLPVPLRGAAPGLVVGPVELPDGGFLTGAVLFRTPVAADDPETRAAAGRAAFADWLAERRAEATVEWHWS